MSGRIATVRGYPVVNNDPSRAARLRVLYVGGIGRSGSTIVGRLLSRLEGVSSIGEVVHLWSRGMQDDHRCGCGERFSRCPFWQGVGARAFGGWGNLEAEQMIGLQQAVDRNRYMPWLVTGRGPAAYRARLTEYVDILSRVYAAAGEESGSDIVVDISKNAPYAWLLRLLPTIDLRVVHLVRHSEGVAYSWSKQDVRRPEVDSASQFMDVVPVGRLAVRWMTANGFIDLLRLTSTPVLDVRYEDLVAAPERTVARIAKFADINAAPADLAGYSAEELELPVEHEVSGNPLRFSSGPVRLRLDDTWRSALSRRDRAIVSAVTAPGMLRYGYWPPRRMPARSHGS
jgi:hypothetical protein